MANQKEKLDIILKAKDQYSQELGRMENRFKVSAKSLAIAGTAAAAVVSSLTAVVMKTAKAGDEFQKMSLRTGFSVKSLSELAHAAELSGTTIQQMEVGFRKLSKNMMDARDGSIAQKRAFDALNITVTTSNGELRDSETVFNEIVATMAGMKNETERSALAMTIFGRSGATMLPLIKSGTAGIDKMRQRAQELGIAFDEDTADAAALFNDNLLEMERNATGAAYAIGNKLIPKVNAFFQFFEDLKKFDTFNEDIKKTYQLQPRGFQPGAVADLGSIEPATGPGSEAEKNRFDHSENDWRNYYNSRLEGKVLFDEQMAEKALLDEEHRTEVRRTFFQMEHQELKTHEESKLGLELNFAKMVEFQRDQARKNELAKQKQFNKLRLQAVQVTGSNITSALDSLNTLNEGRHRETFEALKIAKIAEATVNTYAGATQALGAYPPPYSFIAAGAVIAAGLANVAVISQQQFGGGSAGGGGSSVSPIGSSGPVTPDDFNTPEVADTSGGDGRTTQGVTININNPLSTENWDDIAENEIIPAVNRAGTRNVNIEVN